MKRGYEIDNKHEKWIHHMHVRCIVAISNHMSVNKGLIFYVSEVNIVWKRHKINT